MRSLAIKNIAAILWGAWRRRYLIAVPILAMPILGLLVGSLSPKTYESYTTILIQEAAKQNPFLEDLAVATNLKSRMEALNALLHSRHILSEVAFKMGLINKEMAERERSQKIATLSKALDATLIGDDLIKIRYVSDKPEGMVDILKLVSLRFVERVIAPQRSSIQSSEAFLERELAKRRIELAGAEQELADYKSRFAGELPELHASNVVRLGNMRDALSDRLTALEGARAARETLHSRLTKSNPVIGRLEEEIVGAMRDLAILRSRYTDNHTSVQAALRELGSLEVERLKAMKSAELLTTKDLDRLWNMASNGEVRSENGTQTLLISQLQLLQEAEARIRSLEEETAYLEKEVENLSVMVAGFGEHERRLAGLQRNIDVEMTIYEDLAHRHQMARVTGALGKSEESERVKLIDSPFTPLAPNNMPVFIFVVAGLIGGMALGCGLAVVLELIDTSVRRRDVLAHLLDAPVFTRIPVLPNDGFSTDGWGIDASVFAGGPMEGALNA